MNTTPTPTELAMIAATLAQGTDRNFDSLATDALSLWGRCRDELQAAIKRTEDRAKTPPEPEYYQCYEFALQDRKLNLPPPDRFPLSLDDALRIMLPTIDKSDERLSKFRHFLQDGFDRVPAYNAVMRKEYPGDARFIVKPVAPEKTIAELTKKGVSFERFQSMAQNLLEWRDRGIRTAKAGAGKSGAKARKDAKEAEAKAKARGRKKKKKSS